MRERAGLHFTQSRIGLPPSSDEQVIVANLAITWMWRRIALLPHPLDNVEPRCNHSLDTHPPVAIHCNTYQNVHSRSCTYKTEYIPKPPARKFFSPVQVFSGVLQVAAGDLQVKKTPAGPPVRRRQQVSAGCPITSRKRRDINPDLWIAPIPPYRSVSTHSLRPSVLNVAEPCSAVENIAGCEPSASIRRTTSSDG